MASLYKITVKRNGKSKTYPTWWGSFKNSEGRWERIRLFTDKTASQRRLDEIQQEADLRRAGVLTPLIDHAAKPISQHVADYDDELLRQNCVPMHLRIARATLKTLVELGEWKKLSDITPDSVQAILSTLLKRKLAVTTVNQYLARAKAFVHWLMERGRLAADPLKNLRRADESKAVKKRQRRALTLEEVTALLAAAPPHRSEIYRFVILTGLRRSEIKDLRWADLKLFAPHPFIQLRPEQTKNGQDDQIPLHPDLLAYLKARKQGMPAAKVFKALPEVRTLQKDLDAAAVPFLDEMGRRADFHALRHTYCTLVAQSGATMKEAQTLMRHSDPKLTANVYSHVGMFDTAGALANVTLAMPAKQTQIATGTNGATPEAEADEPCLKIVGKTPYAPVDNGGRPETTATGGADSADDAAQQRIARKTAASAPSVDSHGQPWLTDSKSSDNVAQNRPRSSVG